MKNLKLLLMLTLSISVVLSSCKKEDPINNNPVIEPGTNEMTTGTLNLGSNVVADFFGQIQDESGQPISGVDVTVGNKTATTDADGIFFVVDASVNQDLAYIKAEKSGYFLGSRSVIPSTTSTNSVLIEMLSLDIAGTVSSGQEGTVTVDGASVTLKGHYVDANGDPYNGVVSVAMKYMDPKADATQRQMPGMLYAQDESGDAGALETYGMIAVELFGSSGQALNIAKGSNASIQMPVDPSQIANAPAVIELWHFDENAGYWVQEGAASLINGYYVGSVDHFSFWNCDDFYLDCEFCGLIVDPQGNPIPNAVVTIITDNAQTTGTANGDGTFCTYLPANELVTFEISDACGNQIYYGDMSPCTNGTQNQATLQTQGTTQYLHITGTAQDCQFNPIANGQAEVVINGNSFFYPITNGVIDITMPECALPTSIDIIVTDYASLQQDTQTGVAVVGGTANVGTITTCAGLSEWIDVTVDGNNELWLAPLDCFYTDSMGTQSFTVTGSQPSWIYIQCSTVTPGTYDLVQDINVVTGYSIWWQAFPTIDFGTAPTVTGTFTSWPAVGGYLELTMTGTYYDAQAAPHTLDINLKVQRDF